MRVCLATSLILAACSSTPSTTLDASTPLPDATAAPDADVASPDADVVDSDAAVADPDAAVAACDPPATNNEPGVVRTAYATLRPEELAPSNTYAYRGIRYAAAPTANLRFAAPAAPPCEDTAVHDATTFGAICPQLDRQDNPVGEEDCLFANIWSPQTPPSAPLPVLFFIHGGGNNQGSSSMLAVNRLVYDGAALAALGNVVVTINYRLGALGFATHASLDSESPTGTSGNYALRDQIAALQWVHENISRFGGDPDRVMIFGESAGGVNVCALYTSPLARGLFARALIESGGCVASPKSAGTTATNTLITNANCATEPDPIACLRTKTPVELLQALPPEVTGLAMSDFGPIVDGDVLPMTPQQALASGAHANTPLVLGSNEDETYLLLPPPAMIATAQDFETFARAFLTGAGAPAALIDDLLAIYPLADYNDDPHAALVALTTDWRWSCAARLVLRPLASNPTPPPLYRYYFTRGLDPMRAPMISRAGAYHGLELFYVFGSVDGAGGYLPTAEDLALSALMQRYWSRFAATGDPNASPDPAWPIYDAATDAHLRLDATTVSGTGVRTMQCDAIEAVLR